MKYQQFKTLLISKHARKRILERDISYKEIYTALKKGEVLKEYPDENPYPCYLIYNTWRRKPLHLVIAYDEMEKVCILVTVYRPAPDQWIKNTIRIK